jgi:hypothetical protein
MSSHAGDNDVESCWQQRCRDNLATAQCRCRVMLVMLLPSHAGDDTAEATWPRHDVDVESCWRQCCRVMMAIVLQLKVVLVVVRLRSPPSSEHRGVVAL